MADFPSALTYTLVNEGGGKYTENPNDNGGPTRWGCTLKTLSAYRGKPCTAADVKALTQQEASLIYQKLYWEVMRCAEMQQDAIAMAVFDSSVLFGPQRAGRALQVAVNIVADAKTTPLKVDGRIGPASLAALNAQPCAIVLQAFVTELEEAVTDIVHADSRQFSFLAGWLRRIGAYLVLRFVCVKAPTQAGG